MTSTHVSKIHVRCCALCVLLQTLCDKLNRIGEIGYFLASFQAAIAHITELDLTQDRTIPEENGEDDGWMPPMTEVSLKD